MNQQLQSYPAVSSYIKVCNKNDTISRPTDEISLGSHVHGAPAEGILRGPKRIALMVFAGQYNVSD